MFDLLQRNILRFWHISHGQDNEERIHQCIKPERMRRAERVNQGQECSPDNGAGNPVCHRRAGNTEFPALERLDFRAEHPDNRARAHAKTSNTHHRHNRRNIGDPFLRTAAQIPFPADKWQRQRQPVLLRPAPDLPAP